MSLPNNTEDLLQRIVALRAAPIEPAGNDGEVLHGPQLDGEAQSQAEIDALLASFD